jgi:hypothetical protein
MSTTKTFALALGGLALTAVAAGPAHADLGDGPYANTVAAAATTDWVLPAGAVMAGLDATTVPHALLFQPPACPYVPPATATAIAAPPRPPRYPREVVDRPAIVPFGIGLATGQLAGEPDEVAIATAVEAGLPAGVDVSVGYRQSSGPGGGGGRISGGVGKHLRGRDWWSVAARTRIDVDTAGSQGTSTSGVRVAATFARRVAAWIRPEQLAIPLGGDQPAQLIVPLSAGVQVTRTLWVQADADLQVAELRDGQLLRAVPDAVPLALSTVVSLSPSIDLRMRVGADVTSAGVAEASTWLIGLGYVIGN